MFCARILRGTKGGYVLQLAVRLSCPAVRLSIYLSVSVCLLFNSSNTINARVILHDTHMHTDVRNAFWNFSSL